MQGTLEDRSFLLLLVVVTLGFGWMLKPYFSAIFWAVLLAACFYPVYLRLLRFLHGRDNWAAFCTLIASLLMVVLPLILLAMALAAEAAELYKRYTDEDSGLQTMAEKLQESMPYVQEWMRRLGVETVNLKQIVSDGLLDSSKLFASHAFAVGQNTVQSSINFFIMLYLLFFFLRDGNSLFPLVKRALPISKKRETPLFQRFMEVSRTTLTASLVVACLQGALGGLVFTALGLGGSLLLGVTLALMSFLPLIGSALVWISVAFYLLMSGHVWEGVVLLGFGMLVIALVDILLRTRLLGRHAALPDYLMLPSTLGGITLFGLEGFIVGPLITVLFLSFWYIFANEVRDAPPNA
jgi:predicted PurR-regulated permease PerM